MKYTLLKSNLWLLMLAFSMVMSCNSQGKTNTQKREELPTPNQLSHAVDAQIGQYVVNIFEDSKGNLWFGTMQNGLAKYDGKKLIYFTTEDGLSNNAAVTMVEDKQGNMWIGTQGGLSKFDGKEFTNYTEKDGLCHNIISCLLLDQAGDLWVGTWNGVCKYDGSDFVNFPIPKPDIELPPNPDTSEWITELMQDSKGNMWFGSDGYGACKYDGKSFVHFTQEDGLASTAVHSILEDRLGNFWFGSRVAEKDDPDPSKRFGPGGLNQYDGTVFKNYPNIEGLSESDVYTLYGDDEGNVWISTIGRGIYRYDGREFTNFKVSVSEQETSKSVQSFLKDSKGNLWLGCSGGLYRLNSSGLVNVTIDGPWE